MTIDTMNIAQNVFVAGIFEPTIQYIDVFDLKAQTLDQFEILLAFKVTGLQFFIHRIFHLLVFHLDDEQRLPDIYQ